MLQSLLIRQVFTVAEWILIFVLVVGGTFVGMALLTGRPLIHIAALDLPAADAAVEPARPINMAKSRAEYESIVSGGLFGAKSKSELDTAPAQPEQTEAPPTELKLKLCGTAATSPKDIYASAVILNEENSPPAVNSYGVGDEVVDKVTMIEVYPRKVVLINNREGNNKREELRSEDYDNEKQASAAANPAPQTVNKVALKKTELFQELFTNYADIVTQIKPELYRDANNNVVGITASNLQSIPLAAKLGVKDGDVLQSVNNEPIDSEAKIYELINKYRTANSIRVSILRQGRPVTVEYSLK